MKTRTKLALTTLAAALLAGQAAAAVIPATASGSGSYSNDPSLLTDGTVPDQWTDWTSATNVYWNGTDPTFTLDFGTLYQVRDVLVSVDNNDDYAVAWSADGSTWESLFDIGSWYGDVTWGMDTVSSDDTNPEYVAGIDFSPVTARYLRIQATGGDGYYAVGELQAHGNAVSAVPLPGAAWLFGGALLGLIGLRRRS